MALWRARQRTHASRIHVVAYLFYKMAVVAVVTSFVFSFRNPHERLSIKSISIIEKSIIVNYSHQISLSIFIDCQYN